MRFSFLLALFVQAIALAAYSVAQELEPRAYVNTPKDINFAVLGYAYSSGGVVSDPSIPLENADIEIDLLVLGLARSIEIFGNSGKVDLIVPYASLDGTADVDGEPVARKTEGFGDPRVRLSYLFYGAPSITLDELESYHQDLIIGSSLQLGLPAGKYDADRLVNIGTNRILIKPELGVSKAFGPFILELAGAMNYYTDNDDFFGGKSREQDPIYALQSHLIYSFGRSIWAGLDATYFFGGRTTVDDVEKDDRQENSRVGLTLALPITRHYSLKLYGSTGATTRTGSDFDTVGVALQTRWGGGL